MESSSNEQAAYIKRTRDARVASGLGQAEVAKALGIERTTYTGYEISRPMPGKYVAKFCAATRVTEKWLLTGKGKMHDESDDALAARISQLEKRDREYVADLVQRLLGQKASGRSD